VRPGLRTGEIFKTDLTIKSTRAPLRIVLAYSDYPGRSLVNNLNLIVRSPAGKVYPGNAGSGPDNQNNVEVVHLAKPAAGTWQIQVVGSNVPQGPQEFAIVCKAHQ
jgi:serine protease AprX